MSTDVSYLELSDSRRIAYRRREGHGPELLFLPGFASNMEGTKALWLWQAAADRDLACTLFDYSGHGRSSGAFEDGAIGDWAADALAVLDTVTRGPQIVVGSSMGGWIGLLLARTRRERLAGLIGIAAAPDFTEDLIRPRLTDDLRATLERDGRLLHPSRYDENPSVFTKHLLDEARNQLVMRAPIAFGGPVHLIHGQRDPDVPWQTALAIAARVTSDDVTVELVKDGEHRLSRPQDLARLGGALDRVLAGASAT
ncbi:alpha/beta fold hydrolase [Marinivivus vitaminiproducens]|uniref:alpha/beta fold hydrolase n=1 Tax=Marinivivus vitaminiproducens TaxID=3035935 RepID=UPI0027A3495F|nr:alpha/beta hydrolase [Geminicoccaceae bacterium SCSIO 64248]